MRPEHRILIWSLLLQSTLLFAQIDRVEPPNWWVDMAHNEIELLVYGPDIGDYSVALDSYPGVHLDTIFKAPLSRNYLFLQLSIDQKASPGELHLIFSGKGKKKIQYVYPLLERVNNRKNTKGFDNSDAIYLITPDRFVNGDPMNDVVNGLKEGLNREHKDGRHGGDIKGIANSLDYIRDLGFTAIWMNPMLENDMDAFTYHGYSTTDFYRVDPRFGNNEAFRELCDLAKEKGMKVVMDMIVNHCGLDHWWMKDLPFADWVNQWPEYTGTNHQKTVVLDPYASRLDYKQFFDGWFVPSMPDLNQRNQSMARYLIQNGIWWIEYAGISGIRMDTYPYPDMYFMSDWTKAIMEEYPDFNIVGEEWAIQPTIVSYWQKGKKNPNGYTSHLKSVMDFPLQHALVTSLNKEKSWASSWTDVYAMLGQDYLYPNPKNLVVFPDNHDMSRIFTQVNEDYDLFKLAIAYLATVRGIPQLFYGTEILMKNPGTGDHGIIRSDFPGGWEGDESNAFKGDGLSDQQKAAQKFIKKLFNWRKNRSVIHSGELMHFSPDNNQEVYVLFRYNEQEKVMVIFNKNRTEVSLPLNTYKEILGDKLEGTEILTDKKISVTNTLKLAPMQPMIIELQ